MATEQIIEIKSEYLESLDLIHFSMAKASEHKGGFTMAECRQLLDSREILIDYFTLEDGETELSQPSRLETDALAFIVKLLEVQQLTGVFSFEGSARLIEAVEKLSDALTEKKSPKQRLESARRKLKDRK
jgi:hypothetical protein